MSEADAKNVSTTPRAVTCQLLVGDHVVLRAAGPPDAEYAMFEIGDIELRASEPGRVREHGYQTTADRARARLANLGLTAVTAHDVATALGPHLSTVYARGAAVRRISRYLAPSELLQSDVFDQHRYQGVFLDLTALARDLGIEHAAATLQGLYLAAVLADVTDDVVVFLSTDACTKGGKPGARTYRRPSFADPQRLLATLGTLGGAPRPLLADPLAREDVIAFLRARAVDAVDDDTRALYKSLEEAVASREMPEKGPLALTDLWALEQRLDRGNLDGVIDAIDDVERRLGRTPGTTYLRARAALALGLEPAKAVAERVSALSLSLSTFQELVLLAAEAWLEAGEPRRAMPYARDLVDSPGIDDGLLLRARRVLARTVGAAPRPSAPASAPPSAPPSAAFDDDLLRIEPTRIPSIAPTASAPPPPPSVPSIRAPSVPPLRASSAPPARMPSVRPPLTNRPLLEPPEPIAVERDKPAILNLPPPSSANRAPPPSGQHVPIELEMPEVPIATSFTLEVPAPPPSSVPASPRPQPSSAPVEREGSLPPRRARLSGVMMETRPSLVADPRAEPDAPIAPRSVTPRSPTLPPRVPSMTPRSPSLAPEPRPRPSRTSAAARGPDRDAHERPTPLRPPGEPSRPPMATPAVDAIGETFGAVMGDAFPGEAPPAAASSVALAPTPAKNAYMHGASLPPYRLESPPPLLPKAPLLPRLGPDDELAEQLALPPGVGEPKSLATLPTSVLEARIQFTLLSRELGQDYRQRRGLELRADVSGIEAMQSVIMATFPDHVVRTADEAHELRRHGAFLSEILARRLGAEWLDISPNELGYWVMIVPPDTRVWPFGRVARLVAMGHRERDLVSYFFELSSRARGR